MTNAEKVQEWIHNYTLRVSDESKCSLFIHLKNDGSAVAREALEKIVAKWLTEK